MDGWLVFWWKAAMQIGENFSYGINSNAPLSSLSLLFSFYFISSSPSLGAIWGSRRSALQRPLLSDRSPSLLRPYLSFLYYFLPSSILLLHLKETIIFYIIFTYLYIYLYSNNNNNNPLVQCVYAVIVLISLWDFSSISIQSCNAPFSCLCCCCFLCSNGCWIDGLFMGLIICRSAGDHAGVWSALHFLPGDAAAVTASFEEVQEDARRHLSSHSGPSSILRSSLTSAFSYLFHRFLSWLIWSIFFLQDQPPNDRMINKLCEYASKNPLRIPKVANIIGLDF